MKITKFKSGIFFALVFLITLSCIEAEEALENLAATQTAIARNNTWYVASYGDDSNDCLSTESPCETIQEALDKSSSFHNPRIYLGGIGIFDLPEDPSTSFRDRGFSRDVTIIGSGDQYFPGGGAPPITIKNNAKVVIEGVISFSGFFVESGSLILQNMQIIGSRVPAVTVYGNELVIWNSTISDGGSYGVVTKNDTVATITRSYIGENGGAGIKNSGRMTVTDTRISNNRNFDYEGRTYKTAGIKNTGYLDVVRSLIDNNNGIYTIYNTGPEFNLSNSTVSGNRVTGSESAIIFNEGNMDIIYSTIADNTGVGILVSSDIQETRFVNSLVASNSGGNCDFSTGHPFLEGHNLDTDRSCFPEMTADPNEVASYLDSLRNNGGPTMTHALLLGSPAIDEAEGECPDIDQRYELRPPRGPCDIGAYETNVALMSTSISCEGVQGVSIRDDGTMRTSVKIPGASGEYAATLNDIPITCLNYTAHPDIVLCDSSKPPGNTLATLIIFDDQGEEFCNETFSVPGPSADQPEKDKDEGCNLSVDICSNQGQSFDENKCECVDIQ